MAFRAGELTPFRMRSSAKGWIVTGMTGSWGDTEADYIRSLQAAGRRPRTIRLHQHYLRHLRKHARSPRTITLQCLERALTAKPWEPNTIKSARSVYVSFTRWLHGRGHLASDPGRLLPSVHVPAGVPRPIPEDVLEDARHGADERARLMLLLAAHAGLRAGEIATVHTRDLVDGVLYVEGKGGKTRAVPLVDAGLRQAIADAPGYLFPGRQDGHLSAQWVSKLMARLLPDHWTAHTLRHRAGTNAYDGTRDLLAVSRFLGHSKPETTMVYVQLPDDALRAVAAAAARRHRRAG